MDDGIQEPVDGWLTYPERAERFMIDHVQTDPQRAERSTFWQWPDVRNGHHEGGDGPSLDCVAQSPTLSAPCHHTLHHFDNGTHVKSDTCALLNIDRAHPQAVELFVRQCHLRQAPCLPTFQFTRLSPP